MTFRDILLQFNIPIAPSSHHHARPGWIQFDCPYCGKNMLKYHMGYSTSAGNVSCWRCGGHPLFETLSMLLDLPPGKCKYLLKDLKINDIIPDREMPRGKLSLPNNIKPLKKRHKEYLRVRGFDWKELENTWEIKGIGVSNRLSWRIFIPIIYHGKTISWTTRKITDEGEAPRYLSASLKEEVIGHKEILYGMDYCKRSIIITEGPFDAWKIGPGAVATLGVATTSAQIYIMTQYPRRLVCFDSDDGAQKRAIKLCNILQNYDGETYNAILDGKDAAESSVLEIKQLRDFLS